jgi:biofilm protein TabA
MIHSSLLNDGMFRLLAAIPSLRLALEKLRELPADSADGITELLGRELYVNAHGYDTRPRENCAWESHRHTADVQFCIYGGECIDWLEGLPATSSCAYDAERDFETWRLPGQAYRTATLAPGEYVVFLPGELHRPMIGDGVHTAIRKAVVKINAKLLSPAVVDRIRV